MAIFGDFLHPAFSASRVQHVSDLHPKLAQRHAICGSMADIQSPTAEVRRGKKERKKKPLGKNVMVCPILQGDHKKCMQTHELTLKDCPESTVQA